MTSTHAPFAQVPARKICAKFFSAAGCPGVTPAGLPCCNSHPTDAAQAAAELLRTNGCHIICTAFTANSCSDAGCRFLHLTPSGSETEKVLQRCEPPELRRARSRGLAAALFD